jgi:hypothetical protein
MSYEHNELRDAELKTLLLTLELQLIDPDFRKDRERVSALLADDFFEFGSSGRVWSKASILDLLATEPGQPAPVVEEFEIRRIAAEAVLVTYRTVRPEQVTLRSSVWMLQGGAWQVVFHQGTKVPA